MSIFRRKVKFSVNGIDGLKKSPGRGYFSKGFSVVGILAACVLVGTYSSDNDYKMVSTVIPSRPPVLDLEEYDYSDGLFLEMSNGEDSYIFAGEEEKHILNIRAIAESDAFRLKNLELKISGISADDVTNIKIVDSEGSSYKGTVWNGRVKFKNLFLKIEPGAEVVFSLFADFSNDLKFGQRLYFEIESPEDLDVTKYGERVYIEYDYPLKSSYISVVGKKEVF